MQNSNYYSKDKFIKNGINSDEFKMLSLKLKLIRNINTCVGYIMSALYIIAGIELIKFIVDLYYYFH